MKRGGGFFDRTFKNISGNFKNMFKREKPQNITRKVYKEVKKGTKHVYNKLKETKNYISSKLSTFDARIKKIFIKLLDLLGKEFKEFKEEIAKIHGLNTSFSNKIYKLYFVLKKKLKPNLFSRGKSKIIRGGSIRSKIWNVMKFFGKILGTLVIVLVIICVGLLCGFMFIFGIGLALAGSDSIINGVTPGCPVVLSFLSSNISFFSWVKKTKENPQVNDAIRRVGGGNLVNTYDDDINSNSVPDLEKDLTFLEEENNEGTVGGLEQYAEDVQSQDVLRNSSEIYEETKDDELKDFGDIRGNFLSRNRRNQSQRGEEKEEEYDNAALNCETIFDICALIKEKIMLAVLEKDKLTKSNLNAECIRYINSMNGNGNGNMMLNNRKLSKLILECKQDNPLIKAGIEKDYESYYLMFINYNQNLDKPVKEILDAMRERQEVIPPLNGVPLHELAGNPQDSSRFIGTPDKTSPHRKTVLNKIFGKHSAKSNPKIAEVNDNPLSPAEKQFLTVGNAPKQSRFMSLFSRNPVEKSFSQDMCVAVNKICNEIKNILSDTSNLLKNKENIEKLISDFQIKYKKHLDVSILECRKEDFTTVDFITHDERQTYGEPVNAVILAMSDYTDTVEYIKTIIPRESKDAINTYLVRKHGVSFEKFKQLFGLQKQSKASEIVAAPFLESDDEEEASESPELIDDNSKNCKQFFRCIDNLFKIVNAVYEPSTMKIHKGSYFFSSSKFENNAKTQSYLDDFYKYVTELSGYYKFINHNEYHYVISEIFECIKQTFSESKRNELYTKMLYILDFTQRFNPAFYVDIDKENHANRITEELSQIKEGMKSFTERMKTEYYGYKGNLHSINPIIAPKGFGFGFFGGKTKRSKKQYKTKRTIKRR